MADRSDFFGEIVRGASPDLITVRDSGGKVLFASDACEFMLGITSDAFVGSNAMDRIHPDDIARVDDEQSNTGRDTPAVEHRMRRSDGSWVWVESHTRHQSSESGDLLVGVTRDISARVAAEKLLNRKNVIREAAAAVSPLAIVALDASGSVLSCMGSLFGMEGANAFDRMLAGSEDVGRAAKLALSGSNTNLEFQWEGTEIESRFVSLVGHSVGAIQAVCLFLPQFKASTNEPGFTRH